MSVSKEFDVIVYGATGFTGRLVAEYLSNQYGVDGNVKWAMAGRSEDKLNSVRAEIGAPENTPFVVADANDPASIREMAARTHSVLTTVGPYQLYGSDLVAACVECGTDYVDLCGEPAWMHQMIKEFGEKAKETGARIVFSCGFDSIPFDLGVYFLQNAAKEKFGHTVKHVKGRVRKMKGTFSGGTAASLKATMAAAMQNPEVLEVLKNPFSLTPGFTGAEQPSGAEIVFEDDMQSWVAPFIMAAINTRNIHRSNMLLGHSYGEDFTYDEMMLTGPGEQGQAIAKAVASDKSLASDDAPKPGEGPSKEERETGFYDVLFVGLGDNDERIHVGVTGDKDPGYGSTSKMIAESAICLVKDAVDTPGGIWTPAPAMGQKLIDRLVANAGLTFEVEA
ncbi:trans-acting enoyl reductase family protein [Kordiimonas sp. SCSIO 12610]|uniref:saccharopine dehydrogenase family protein n=1 Tax=Kordiimonas sp. SCSIO 12610 TaxID=2829597 RepID=UPI0021096A84|nr:saccharopine dehydrogenase NADP-binding domain-containing protein [Kordiimonas sp. SCSIO 12610]UTW54578.1 saccharopine dehydrogenase NADP-binding domain-containing protein [Kordiimonas sp. SCSIO 12610]